MKKLLAIGFCLSIGVFTASLLQKNSAIFLYGNLIIVGISFLLCYVTGNVFSNPYRSYGGEWNKEDTRNSFAEFLTYLIFGVPSILSLLVYYFVTK